MPYDRQIPDAPIPGSMLALNGSNIICGSRSTALGVVSLVELSR